MTVGEMLARMDSRELGEWMAYDRIDPFGNGRADLQAGVVASTVANAAGSKRRFKPSDFIPRFGSRTGQSVESMRANFRAFKDAVERARKKRANSGVK